MNWHALRDRSAWRLGALLLAMASSSAALAQAQPWTLRQAYAAAWREDASLRAARAAATSARERLPQAQSQLRPNIGFSASTNLNDLSRTQPNLLGVSSTTESRYRSHNQTLQVRQALYRKPLWLAVEQAQYELAAADAILGKEERSLAERLTGAYLEALLAQDQLLLVRAQRTFVSTALDAARKSVEAGTGTRTDVDDAQARLDLNTADELEARQALAASQRQLSVLVNADVVTLVPLKLAAFAPGTLEPGALADWIAKAEQANPELASLRAQREAARLELAKASAGHRPTLDAVAQWTRSGNENVASASTRYSNLTLGVQLNVPLYGGGYQSALVRQAAADLLRVDESMEARRRALGVDVQARHRDITEGVLRIRALEQAVRSATQRLLSSRRSLEAGVRTVVDVLNAEQQLQQAQRDLARARYVYALAVVRLRVLAGEEQDRLLAGVSNWFE